MHFYNCYRYSGKKLCNFIFFLDLFSFSSPSTPSPDNDENVTEDDEDKL